MADTTTDQFAFPAARTLCVLTGLALAIGGVLWLALPHLVTDDAETVRQAVMVMVGIAWLSSLFSVLPLAACSKMGVTKILLYMKAYFLGAAFRVVLCIAGVVVAVKVMHLPRMAVVVSLIAVYLPSLFTETSMVIRFLKHPNGPKGTAVAEALS